MSPLVFSLKSPKCSEDVYPSYAGVVRELKAEFLRQKRELRDTDENYPELMELRREHWD